MYTSTIRINETVQPSEEEKSCQISMRCDWYVNHYVITNVFNHIKIHERLHFLCTSMQCSWNKSVLKELTQAYNKSKLSHRSLKYNDNLYIH